MKYDGKIVTYRFIGDSSVNRAMRLVKGEPTETYTQTDIINAFSEKRSLVCGGSKLIANKNNERIGYIIYFGDKKSNPDQIIRITIEKEMIEKGDINALAIDSLCQYAIRVNKKNNKKLAATAVASALAAIGLAGAIIGSIAWAADKEAELQSEETKNYKNWIRHEQMEEGTYKEELEQSGLMETDDSEIIIESTGRSY